MFRWIAHFITRLDNAIPSITNPGNVLLKSQSRYRRNVYRPNSPSMIRSWIFARQRMLRPPITRGDLSIREKLSDHIATISESRQTELLRPPDLLLPSNYHQVRDTAFQQEERYIPLDF